MAKKMDSDAIVVRLMEEVKKRRSEIAQAERGAWRTNGIFSFDQSMNSSINLNVVNDKSKLIEMAAFILGKERDHALAVETLGIDDPPPFTWFGFSSENWIADFRTRINKLSIDAKRKKLEEFESKLNDLVSPDMRRKMELDAIANEIGNF